MTNINLKFTLFTNQATAFSKSEKRGAAAADGVFSSSKILTRFSSTCGCRACIVLLSKYDHVHEKVEDFTVSSCLTLLSSINGFSITTNEVLGNIKDGFHTIQKRTSGFHASQCGFCTPGMCMSLFAALVNAEKTQASNLRQYK
ncbi:probable aldehyde oxidase 4 [Papaver somniferum]|uniref:probable aldehyde oxidase 4 n=1 Tax=Papaver somniferum TaxID=3469 RepID=UPI000E6FCE3C|nr:probable aldehyde oxidase 4 [Papaver somniferum]